MVSVRQRTQGRKAMRPSGIGRFFAAKESLKIVIPA